VRASTLLRLFLFGRKSLYPSCESIYKDKQIFEALTKWHMGEV
jgi:hypothetical protein